MTRTGADGDRRCNLNCGAEPHALSGEERSTAVRATDLSLSGVAMPPSARGPALMAANASPGLDGAGTSAGIDIAWRIDLFTGSHATGPRAPRGGAPVGAG